MRAYLIADVRHDKESRVINHLEDIACVYLMIGHRFFNMAGQKPRALDTGGWKETLRVFPKQQRRRVENAAVVIKQTQRFENLSRRCVRRDIPFALNTRLSDKLAHLGYGEILQLDIGGIGTIKRKDTYETFVLQALSESSVNGGAQVVVTDEASANHIRVDTGNERGLSRISVASRFIYKTDARLVALRRPLILAFCRRNAR